MKKLLDAFILNPNQKTAAALMKYLAKHPMSAALASPDDCQWIKKAEDMASRPTTYLLGGAIKAIAI